MAVFLILLMSNMSELLKYYYYCYCYYVQCNFREGKGPVYKNRIFGPINALYLQYLNTSEFRQNDNISGLECTYLIWKETVRMLCPDFGMLRFLLLDRFLLSNTEHTA